MKKPTKKPTKKSRTTETQPATAVAFEDARQHLLAALENMRTLFTGTKPETQAPETQEQIYCKELRRRLNRVVCIQAATKRLTPREIWIILYERLRQLVGFNAIAVSTAEGMETHLDAVQSRGLLPLALGLAFAM